MIGSLIAFVAFIIIYLTISDIITVLFRLTGLTEEKARFQVVSLLTNSGYTTQESEAVVASKHRRILARATMIFGYAFTVTIVSTVVNLFMSWGKSELSAVLVYLPTLAVIFAAYYLTRRTAFFRTRFDGWIEKIGSRLLYGKNTNKLMLMEDYGELVVAHIYLHKVPRILRGVPLSKSGIMPNHSIMVMLVKDEATGARQANAHTVLKTNDVIVVLGKLEAIREVFEKDV